MGRRAGSDAGGVDGGRAGGVERAKLITQHAALSCLSAIQIVFPKLAILWFGGKVLSDMLKVGRKSAMRGRQFSVYSYFVVRASLN
jgi:hypothetical protein